MGRLIAIGFATAIGLAGLILGANHWVALRVSSDKTVLAGSLDCIKRKTRNKIASRDIIQSCNGDLQFSAHQEGGRRVERVYLREGYPQFLSSKSLMLYRSSIEGEGEWILIEPEGGTL